MRSTGGLTTTIAVGALAWLLVGCSQDKSISAEHAPASAASSADTPHAGLPSGVIALGQASPVAAQGWGLSVTPFEEAPAGDATYAGVPAGWSVLKTTARFTNKAAHVARLPQTTLTVRYGAFGREAVPVKGGSLTGLPARDDAVRQTPGGTFTAEIGVGVPPQALGQRVTVTAEATQEGLAQADNLFFEGSLPGKLAAPDNQAAPKPRR
ncbi:hypothetical protein AB0D66_22200 [Streptomyces sp. NPDC048270]|uniref:hypothetical protein n=1 Tax=Streptomyces sp. NPDC048270 TaxID=3154615 RepID=UPI0033D9350A